MGVICSSICCQSCCCSCCSDCCCTCCCCSTRDSSYGPMQHRDRHQQGPRSILRPSSFNENGSRIRHPVSYQNAVKPQTIKVLRLSPTSDRQRESSSQELTRQSRENSETVSQRTVVTFNMAKLQRHSQ